jgi:hypothetical protein
MRCPVHHSEGCRCGYARLALVAVLFVVACGAFTAPLPASVVQDTYAAAKAACSVYAELPPAQHKPAADKACEAVLAVCAPDDGAAP